MSALAHVYEQAPSSYPPDAETALMLADIVRDDALAIDLGAFWGELASASWTISGTFFTHDRGYALVRPVQRLVEPRLGVPSHQLAVLERVLLSGSQKIAAIDSNLAASTVAQHCKQALRSFGLSCGASRVPLFVVMAAHAFHGLTPFRYARASAVVLGGQEYRLIEMARPETLLAQRFSRAQYEVARLFVEGKRHSTIALDRRTSVRTVANQLAAVFTRLGVSGRCELLRHLVRFPYSSGGPRGGVVLGTRPIANDWIYGN